MCFFDKLDWFFYFYLFILIVKSFVILCIWFHVFSFMFLIVSLYKLATSYSCSILCLWFHVFSFLFWSSVTSYSVLFLCLQKNFSEHYFSFCCCQIKPRKNFPYIFHLQSLILNFQIRKKKLIWILCSLTKSHIFSYLSSLTCLFSST